MNAGFESNSGQTLLWWAAEQGHKAVVSLILGKDEVNAGSKSSSGQMLLWWAAEQRHEVVVSPLAERADVDVDSKDKDGRTPLLRAAARGHEAVVRLLVKRNDVDAGSATGLHWPFQDFRFIGAKTEVRVLEELKFEWQRTSLFLTKEGYLGLGPRVTAQVGDTVCVVPGCRVPLLFRSVPSHHREARMKAQEDFQYRCMRTG